MYIRNIYVYTYIHTHTHTHTQIHTHTHTHTYKQWMARQDIDRFISSVNAADAGAASPALGIPVNAASSSSSSACMRAANCSSVPSGLHSARSAFCEASRGGSTPSTPRGHRSFYSICSFCFCEAFYFAKNVFFLVNPFHTSTLVSLDRGAWYASNLH